MTKITLTVSVSVCVSVCSQALCGQLQQRGFSVYDVDIFLESSNTPLPLNSDCFPLASSLLHVRCETRIASLY